MGRIVLEQDLGEAARTYRGYELKIVTANGCFDLLHYGHIRFLQEARQQGDILFVGVNDDAYVRQRKGPSRPIVPLQQRLEYLAALECVDVVFSFSAPTPIPFLEVVRPDVHANGADYGPDCIEAKTVRNYGGRLHLIAKIPGWSTSELVQRIRDDPQ